MFKLTALMMFCIVSSHVFADEIELPPEVKQMIQNLHNTCIGESGATEAQINTAKTGQFDGTESLKCYMKCLLASVGIMDDDGAVDHEAYLDLLPDKLKPYGQKVVDTCKIEGTNACDIAYNLNVCSYKVDPSKYLLY